MPTSAWAIMPSAGDRRGSDGTAGTSYSERAKPAASRAERWGRLPTPVDAPARSDVKAGTPRASGRDVVTGRGCGPSGGPTSITRSSLTDRLAPSANLVTQHSRYREGSVTRSTLRRRVTRWRRDATHLAAVGDGDKADAVPERREPTTLATLTSSGAVFVWAARVVWLVVAVLGGRAVGDALAGRSRAVQVTGTVAAWAGWGAAALTLAVTGVLALTALRSLVPGALVVTVATVVGGATASSALALAAPAIVAVGLTCSAELGACTSRRRRTATSSASGSGRPSATSPPRSCPGW